MSDFVLFVLLMWLVLPALDHDDTDPPKKEGAWFRDHSGLRLYIDHRTGCHYIGSMLGGVTPRLDENGKHICEKVKT